MAHSAHLESTGIVETLSGIQESTVTSVPEQINDYFVEKDGQRFAGSHLLLDLWGARRLTDINKIEDTLTKAADAAGATILDRNFHQFIENGGISGVLVLAESHISIHTWPERSFAAIDIFMCGRCDPFMCVDVLKAAFEPDDLIVHEQRWGLER